MGQAVSDVVEGVGDVVGSITHAAEGVVKGVLDNPQGLILAAGIALATGGLGALAAPEIAAVSTETASTWEAYATMGAQEAAAVGDTALATTASTAPAAALGTAAAGGTAATAAAPAAGVIDNLAGAGQTFDAFGTPIANEAAATTQAAQTASSTAANVGANMTAQGAPTAAGGLLDSADAGGGLLNWAQENPKLAGPLGAATIMTAGGALSGMANRQNALDLEKSRADLALRNQIELREWLASHNTLKGKLPITPTGATLQHPGGSPVYNPSNGLLFSGQG